MLEGFFSFFLSVNTIAFPVQIQRPDVRCQCLHPLCEVLEIPDTPGYKAVATIGIDGGPLDKVLNVEVLCTVSKEYAREKRNGRDKLVKAEP